MGKEKKKREKKILRTGAVLISGRVAEFTLFAIVRVSLRFLKIL